MSDSPFLVWTKDLSVGFENLDNQHKTIFAMINRLLDAAEEDRHAVQSVPAILQNLLDYTHWHFAAEEAAMRKQGVSDLAFHRRHHAAMTSAIQDLVSSNWKCSGRFPFEAVQFLRKWWTQHIRTVDLQYKPAERRATPRPAP